MKDPKVIAFYLPQYHRVKENDIWWGDGFTDWVSAKNARELFKGHNQPRIPLNKNYYDLMDKKVIEWQAALAQKANIYGFCYYHYWFGNGKQILEKPAENLLKWKEINQRFCFSWANQSWIRSWSKYDGNVWSGLQDKFAEKRNSGDSDYLMKQEYGNEQEWRRHFDYLIPFFMDDRYIKVDGKPMFIIHRISDIPCVFPMVRCFKRWALDAGLPGIYIVATNEFKNRFQCIDATALFEPSYTYRNGKEFIIYRNILGRIRKSSLTFYSYSYIWLKILARKKKLDNHVYLGAFTDFDTTPRQGEKGIVMKGVSARRFSFFFHKLVEKSRRLGSEFVFINAWNEWGEGAYLEPDERNRYRYLSAVYRGKK